MALIAAKLLRIVGRKSNVLSPGKRLLAPSVVGGQTQVANLTSVKHGYDILEDRPPPFPYETKTFGYIAQYIDSTRTRFNENTRVVVIDGSIGIGKEKFAMKFAEEFDMKYFPDIKVDEVFTTDTGFDLREVDYRLPDRLRQVDLRRFYTYNNVERNLGIGRTQLLLYERRYFQWMKALQHLLNTGQGVVMNAGVFSDIVYAQTLRDFGYFTQAGFKYYCDLREESICDLWKPHLIIYLDASVAHIRDLINKRNNPIEKNSPVLTDKYLQAIEDNYKQKYLPSMQKYTEVLMYDAEVDPQWDFVVEDCESLTLDKPTEDRPQMFCDWMTDHENEWNRYRMLMGRPDLMQRNFFVPIPFSAPELTVRGEDADLMNEVLDDFPEALYLKGYIPGKDDVLFKW